VQYAQRKAANRHNVCLLLLLCNVLLQHFCVLCKCVPLCLFAGILACLDGYMNIAMEQTEVSTACSLQDRFASTDTYEQLQARHASRFARVCGSSGSRSSSNGGS
jgi:hypothetical protein